MNGLSIGTLTAVQHFAKSAGDLSKAKAKGFAWVNLAAPIIFGIAKNIKKIKDEKEETTRLMKLKIVAEDQIFNDVIKSMEILDKTIRAKFMCEYTARDTIEFPLLGEIIIKSPWEFTITDPARVPIEYWSVNEALIKEDIKNGVRVIPGVEISQGRSMVVMPSKAQE